MCWGFWYEERLMQKTKIEWVKNPDGTQGYSWNPIKGLCPVGCWYCYGTRYYERFWHLHGYPVEFYENEIEQIYKLKKPSGIFLCSVFEIFHDITKTDFRDSGEQWTNWRDCIFDTIEDNPQHRFYVLTKFPQNIDRPMPDNVWLGVTVTQNKDWHRARKLQSKSVKAKIKFISLEPLLERVDLPIVTHIDWIVIGKLTGFGKKHDPHIGWLKEYVFNCKYWEIPLFLKNNLKEIWAEPLVQELPNA